MIAELRAMLSELLPLRIEVLDFNDPVLVLAGDGWSVSVACPWRLMAAERLVASIEEGSGAASKLRRLLVGSVIVDVVSRETGYSTNDPVFVLSDGTTLELFADTDLDPWVVRVQGKTFVGSASKPT